MRIISNSPRQTLKIGRLIARSIKLGDILCLFGELGAGKTVLVKGIAIGLGIKQEEIISPTFVLLREHKKAKLRLNHFDLYRLDSPQDILGLGYEEFFYNDAVTVVEWADRLGALMPEGALKIILSVKGKTKRLIRIEAEGKRYKELLKDINEDIRH